MSYGHEHQFDSHRGKEATVSAIDELRERLVAVEDRVEELAVDAAATRAMAAMADRDVAMFRPAMSGHTGVLNALRETQIEQGHTLVEHSRMLDEQGRTLAGHSRILAEHTRKLDEHTRILVEHSRMLDAQGRTLAEHTRKLDEHTRKFDEQDRKLDDHGRMLTAIVRHLGIALEDGERPPHD